LCGTRCWSVPSLGRASSPLLTLVALARTTGWTDLGACQSGRVAGFVGTVLYPAFRSDGPGLARRARPHLEGAQGARRAPFGFRPLPAGSFSARGVGLQ